MKTIMKFGAIYLILGALIGCSTDVQVVHAPLVAQSDEEVTFRAEAVTNTTPESFEIQLFVNGVLEQTCDYSPCEFTGGPYVGLEDAFLYYNATITAEYDFLGIESTQSDSTGYYYSGVTDNNYDWNGSVFLWARYHGSTNDHEDLVFHRSDDYVANGLGFDDFIGHATNKVNTVLAGQDIIDANMDGFNFWVYTKDAQSTGCGTVHSDANTDMPWRDDDAVLHDDNFQDCTNAGLSHFSAEGSNTKAFLHESGHAVFGLGDEYDGPTNYTIVQSPEPNIFDTEALCRAEQTAKNRDPDECYEFTTRQGGWWGIHQGTTVMRNGNVGEPWYAEAAERVRWYFDNL